MARYHLGINLGFAINRFPEPTVWARVVRRELGLDCVQFVADLLNPFLPEPVFTEQARLVRQVTQDEGIHVQSLFTSAFTRVNHLMHPDERQRALWLDWLKRFADLAAELGAETLGSHFGIMSVTDEADPARRAARIEGAVAGWQELSRHAAGRGLRYLIFEPMSCPRENGWTIKETADLRNLVNQAAAIPMEVCLDVGHAPHPDERDPYEWLAALGPVSPVIHLQQTEAGQSRHWPFTPEHNAEGIIDAGRVLDLLDQSGRPEHWLYLEISHRERWPDDTRVVADLRASAEYWQAAMVARA